MTFDRGSTIVAGRPSAESGVARPEQAIVKEYVDRTTLFMRSTGHLLEMAKEKDDYLTHHSADLGPKAQGEIAKTLLAIRDVVKERIAEAPLGRDGVRTPEGVSWKPGDPLAGSVEGVAPFGRAAAWQSYVDKAAAAEKLAGRPEPERRAHEYGPNDERGRVATPADGVGFRYRSARLEPGQIDRWLNGLPPEKREALKDPEARVVITGSASPPGTDKGNLALSQQRSDAVAGWLRDHGAKAVIESIGVGERPAREEGRLKGDRAEDRIARVEFVRWSADFRGDSTVVEGYRGDTGPKGHEAEFQTETAERLLFSEPFGIVTQAHDEARLLASLSSGVSREALQAGRQISGLMEKLVPEAAPVTLFLGWLDALVEIGESGRSKDVSKVRQEYYDAVAVGTARGLDSRYGADLPSNPILRAAAERAERESSSLRPTEQRNLSEYLGGIAAGSHGHSRDDYEQYMNGTSYREALNRILSPLEYRIR